MTTTVTGPGTPSLPTLPVHALQEHADPTPWLVRTLWGAAAVGVIGGAPKACKSWLGLEMAVAVASGTACLGRFNVESPGPVVVYLAEDALPAVRDRVQQLCQHRGLALAGLDLHVVTAPSLRLDLEQDRQALDQTLAIRQPKLLVLDPLVRLHRLDEIVPPTSPGCSASCVSSIANMTSPSSLSTTWPSAPGRIWDRPCAAAPTCMRRPIRPATSVHRREQVRLTVQHRAAPAPQPMLLRLAGGDGEPCRLQLDGEDVEPPPLAEAVRDQLRHVDEPCSRARLRQLLRVNNARLGDALRTLEQRGLVVRGAGGWRLPDEPEA